MDSLWQDVRFAVRSYLRRPLFLTVALLTLALGIGVTSMMFSVVDGVLLRPLDYPDSHELVRVYQVRRSTGEQSAVSPPNFFDVRERSRAFRGLAAFWSPSLTISGAGGNPERVLAATCSHDLFGVLGVGARVGRVFAREDDVPGAAPVAVLSHGLWQRRFGGDPGILGRELLLDKSPTVIVGVMPAGFDFPSKGTELWVPLRLSRTQPPSPAIPVEAFRQYRILEVVARLRPDRSIAESRDELAGIARALEQEYPDANHDTAMGVMPLREAVVGTVRPALLILLGAVCSVLLIACTNVGSLLMVRAAARSHEIAIRTALGANRSRLVRQVLTESVVLGLAGGALGLALGTWGLHLFVRFAPGDIPRLGEVRMDGGVIAATLVTATLTGLLFGLAPALRRHGDLQMVLRAGGRGTSVAARPWARRGLVIGEVALSLVLLVVAGLLIQSFIRVQGVDRGFRPSGLLTLDRIELTSGLASPRASAAFFERLLAEIRGIPGIDAAGATLGLPLDPRARFFVDDSTFSIEGQPSLPVGERPSVALHVVSADYLKAIGVPLKRGRWFGEGDRGEAPGVVLVNEAMARRSWPAGDPVGRRITLDLAVVPGQAATRTVIGVVGDMRHFGLEQPAEPQAYVPHLQMPWPSMAVVIRTSLDARAVGPAVREAVWRLDRGIPVPALRSMDEMVAGALGQPKFRATLLGMFAASALVLAMVGLYGTMAYTVEQRRREIGLRLALGATPRQTTTMLVRQGLVLTILGIALGLAGAAAVTRVLSAFLVGIGTSDPTTFAAVSALIVALAAVACYLPARSVYRIDPVKAIGSD